MSAVLAKSRRVKCAERDRKRFTGCTAAVGILCRRFWKAFNGWLFISTQASTDLKADGIRGRRWPRLPATFFKSLRAPPGSIQFGIAFGSGCCLAISYRTEWVINREHLSVLPSLRSSKHSDPWRLSHLPKGSALLTKSTIWRDRLSGISTRPHTLAISTVKVGEMIQPDAKFSLWDFREPQIWPCTEQVKTARAGSDITAPLRVLLACHDQVNGVNLLFLVAFRAFTSPDTVAMNNK